MTIDTATGLEAPAELSSERVRDIFSHIARKYERFNALSSFGAYKLWLAGMMRQAPIDESHDVLDIAGGTGDVTFTVARTKHPRHIQCTDLVPEMLDVARMHIDEGDGAGVPIDFEVVDAQNIPYEDASYDVITMAYGIRNMPDRPRALEMFRVLKPGGSLCVPGVLHAAQWRMAGAVPLLPAPSDPVLGRAYYRRQRGLRVLGEVDPRLPRPGGAGRDDARCRLHRRHLEKPHRRHRRRPRSKEAGVSGAPMFGFVAADAGALSEEEKERYRAVYCGLCLALRDRYGQLSRACLTYDLTFFVLLCNSLHEPVETQGASHCVMHPAPAAPRPWALDLIDYAADLSVALAYHKVLDDVADDGDLKARAAERLLAGAYERAPGMHPRAVRRDRAGHGGHPGHRRGRAQQRRCSFSGGAGTACDSPFSADATDAVLAFDPDAAAHEFGRMLGRLFAHNQGFWAETMEELGRGLGRFIYLMDAAVDFADDAETGSYNPFVALGSDAEAMRATLALAAADAAVPYERLPLVQDAHLMDSILFRRLGPVQQDPSAEASCLKL